MLPQVSCVEYIRESNEDNTQVTSTDAQEAAMRFCLQRLTKLQFGATNPRVRRTGKQPEVGNSGPSLPVSAYARTVALVRCIHGGVTDGET